MSTDHVACNEVSGLVNGPVVQAGSVYGGIHVHQPRPSSKIPRQLPPVPAHFTNRAVELRLLDNACDNSKRVGPVVVVITGIGGIGKTALALHWLHHNVSRFSDGQLYLDLTTCESAELRKPQELLSMLLRGLGVPAANIPFDITEQAALFRSSTADKALVILLDNATSAAQVRPLLPASPRCVVVVTSRWRLPGLATARDHIIFIDALETDTSVELLKHIVGIERFAYQQEAAREVAVLCGGMPIALCVAAARLSAHQHWTMSRVAHALKQGKDRLNHLTIERGDMSVRASFDLSYQELSTEAARLYRLLSLHPGIEFCAGVAARSMGFTVVETIPFLEELVEANLVSEVTADRYRFHDLLRLHAQQQLENHESAAECLEVVRGIVDWYLDQALAADVIVTPLRWRLTEREAPTDIFSDMPEALDWLTQELPNLMAILRTAFTHEWDEQVWQLGEAMWGLFLYRSHYPEWISTYEIASQAAARINNPAAESHMLVRLGAAYLRLKKFTEAGPPCRLALERARASGNWRSIATALENMGAVVRGENRLAEAISYYRQAFDISAQHGQLRGMALQLRYLGYALSEQHKYVEAIDHFQRSAELSTTINDVNGLGQSLAGIGAIRGKQGNYAEAISVISEGLTCLSPTTAPALRAHALERLAEVSYQSGDTGAAQRHWSEALSIYHALGDPRAEQLQLHLDSLTIN